MTVFFVNAEGNSKDTDNALDHANQLIHELTSCQGELVFNTKTGKTDCVSKNTKIQDASCEMSFAGCNGSFHLK